MSRRGLNYRAGRCALLIGTLLLALGSCAPLRQAVALLRSTDDFTPLRGGVHIEEPADSLFGARIAGLLPALSDSVEARLAIRFVKPVTVFVCHSTQSFCRHTGSRHPGPRASVHREFFVSPRLAGSADWEAIVYHELVHVVLRQHLGAWRYQRIPIWFHEGLATLISSGGGSGDVSDGQALSALGQGEHFEPVAAESFLLPRSFENPRISIWVHYRQAMLFVRYLRERDGQAFGRLMADLLAGRPFGASLKAAYGRKVRQLWESFLLSECATDRTAGKASPERCCAPEAA